MREAIGLLLAMFVTASTLILIGYLTISFFLWLWSLMELYWQKLFHGSWTDEDKPNRFEQRLQAVRDRRRRERERGEKN